MEWHTPAGQQTQRGTPLPDNKPKVILTALINNAICNIIRRLLQINSCHKSVAEDIKS
jgi:hypothetical protein